MKHAMLWSKIGEGIRMLNNKLSSSCWLAGWHAETRRVQSSRDDHLEFLFQQRLSLDQPSPALAGQTNYLSASEIS